MIIEQLLSVFSNVIYLYSMALGVYALLSWFPGGYESSIGRFLAKICEPYISIFDRLNLSLGGLNFSILLAIFTLNFGSKVLIAFITRIFGVY